MILITGAAGKTGRAVIKALAQFNFKARILAKDEKEAALLRNDSPNEVFIGDLRDETAMLEATRQIDMIYLICPNVFPDELEIGKRLLAAAQKNRVSRIVYHSVLHPHVEAMPHHWQKMRLEEAIFQAGIDFTILQPCAYMQNILAGWEAIVKDGIFSIPYNTSARISMVDLDDIGMAAAVVMSQSGHENAIYELAGPEPLSQDDTAVILGKELKRKVKAITQDRNEWEVCSRASGMNDYACQTLLRMFEYYEKFGLVGNSRMLEILLGRPTTRFAEFVKRQIQGRANIE
jgi:NAD(P)H dehydrogenase (quinone)